MIIQNIKSVDQAPHVKTAHLPVHQNGLWTKNLYQHQIIKSLKYWVFSQSESLCGEL